MGTVIFKRTKSTLLLILMISIFNMSYSRHIEDDKVFEINKASSPKEFAADFLEEDASNEFKVKLASKEILLDQNLYIILESENTDFYLNIWTNASRNNKTVSLKVGTYSGNCIFVLGSGLFNGKLNYVQDQGKFYFGVRAVDNQTKDKKTKFKITVMTGKKLSLPMGKIYTTMIDSGINFLDTDLMYDGSKIKDLQKLRFQMTAIRTIPDWKMSATVSYGSNNYQMNPIFKKSVGGILSQPLFPLCHEKKCLYTISITILNVHLFNIETFLIGKTEQLSIGHYENYYDKVYNEGETTIYELPYTEEMYNLDVSISLTPVSGSTDLYVNANTLPKTLDSYDFSEKGHLAKRITIRWEQLVKMKAEKSSLYIAVHSSFPGEFLIKVDAHDQGFRGSLEPGIIESGMVEFDEISNYMYNFEVIETQEITFDVKLNINSGDGDLFVMQCSDYSDCQVKKEDLNSQKAGLLQVSNNMNEKDITHTFTCEHNKNSSATLCQFVVGVSGKENHGTHYEISLRESKFHRLIIPGHSISLDIEPQEKTYVKLSFPHRASEDSQLYLSVESLWGTFSLSISKTEEYPSVKLNDIYEKFDSTSGSSMKSLRTIEIKEDVLSDKRLEGTYYVCIEAVTEASINLKFVEKNDSAISIHTLTAGKQIRGQISTSSEVVFYSIRVSLDDIKANSIVVNMTPVKGTFIMFANRDGNLPSINNHEYFSENNHLELKVDHNKKTTEEFFIGIQLHNINRKEQITGNFQYLLSLSYSDKPIKLSPGILASHTIQKSNVFLIRVLKSFEDLLVLKSIVDGFNMNMCAKFTTSEKSTANLLEGEKCDFSANEREVSLYIKKEQLTEECDKVKKISKNHKPNCYLMLSVKGFQNQSFGVGYTYNNKPFHLVKGKIINGPWILNSKAKINFLYHPEDKKEIGIYFNAKGAQLNVYSRLLNSENFDESMSSQFPSENQHDEANITRIGYVQNIYYSKSQVEAAGRDPELLLSVQSALDTDAKDSDLVFKGSNNFIIQTAMDCVEIMRTQTISQQIREGEWNYYSFYNNGNTDSLKVYVISGTASPLKVMISLGLTSRPPITNKPLITKTGISSVEIDIKPKDLKQSSHENDADLKGYYVVAIQSSTSSNINVYWNNKIDLNYIELTPNEPSTMLVSTQKKLYFAFYASDVVSSGKKNSKKLKEDIRIYFKIDVKATVYVLKSPSGDLDAPSDSNFTWKASTADSGGLSMIEIKVSHKDYCVDCLYIGYVEVSTPGQLTVLANIKHNNVPIHLKPGFTFPEFLDSKKKNTFRVINPDSSPIDLSFSMMSGYVNIYISRVESVSTSNYDEMYSMESKLNAHHFIQLSPEKYKLQGMNQWFILVENPKNESAAFTLTVDKNNIRSPIEPGVTKYVSLGRDESARYSYKLRKDEDQFELRVELDQVVDSKLTSEALDIMDSYIDLVEIRMDGEELQLDFTEMHTTHNKVYIKFTLPKNTGKTFGIEVTNPVDTPISLRIDLLNGNYKLINFNTYNLGRVGHNKTMIYEAYGIIGKYLFVDVRKCFGSPKVSFYQTDFQNVEDDKSMRYKVIKDQNSNIQYVKLTHQKVFIKVEGKKDDDMTMYTLNAYSEKDMELNPYSEISKGTDGKVDLEIDTHKIRVKPLILKSSLGKDFTNKIKYSVYLSPDVKVMRYAKNCGVHMIHKAFDKPDILEFKFEVEHTDQSIKNKKKEKKGNRFTEMLKNDHIEIQFNELNKNTKYYGIVVAKVDLYPIGEGYLNPVRSAKAYFDEFIIVTPQIVVPVQMIISTLIMIAMLCSCFCIIKSYIFGNVNQMENISEQIPQSLKEFDDDSSYGFKAFSLLERAYNDEKDRMETDVMSSTAESQLEEESTASHQNHEHQQEQQNTITAEDHCQEIEMENQSDKKVPLDG